MDDPVYAISIDTVFGAIMRASKPVYPELLPLGGNIDSAMGIASGRMKSTESMGDIGIL